LWTVEECKDAALYTREEREEEGDEEDNEKPKLKKADTNTYEYVQEYGFERADVEALGFGRMREEVQNFIERHTVNYLWEESQHNSRLEVMRGKALLSLYTLKPEAAHDEFEVIYSGFLSDGMSESEAIAEMRDFIAQREDVTTRLLETMSATVSSDFFTLLEAKEEALDKQKEESWSSEESICGLCRESIIYRDNGSAGQFWTHNIDNDDALLCADGSGNVATPAE